MTNTTLNGSSSGSFDIKRFIHLAICNFSFFLEFTLFYIFPVYLYSLGASRFYIGFYNNLPSFWMVIFVLFFSGIIRRCNPKTIMLWAFALNALSMVIMYLFHESLVILFLAKALSSLVFVLGFAIFMSRAYEIIPAHRKTSLIAVFGIAGLSSNPFGSFIGERLFAIDPRYISLFSLAVSVVAFILLLTMDWPNQKTEQNKAPLFDLSMFSIIARKKMILPMLITFIYFGCLSVFVAFIPILTKERLELANMSSFFLSFSLIGIFVRVSLIPYFDKLKQKVLILIAFSSITVAFIGSLFIQNLVMLFGIGLFYGIGHSILFPVLSSLFVSMGKTEQTHQYNNLYLGTGYLGSLVVTSLLGKIGDITGTEPIFIVMIVLLLALIAVIALFFHPQKKSPKKS